MSRYPKRRTGRNPFWRVASALLGVIALVLTMTVAGSTAYAQYAQDLPPPASVETAEVENKFESKAAGDDTSGDESEDGSEGESDDGSEDDGKSENTKDDSAKDPAPAKEPLPAEGQPGDGDESGENPAPAENPEPAARQPAEGQLAEDPAPAEQLAPAAGQPAENPGAKANDANGPSGAPLTGSVAFAVIDADAAALSGATFTITGSDTTLCVTDDVTDDSDASAAARPAACDDAEPMADEIRDPAAPGKIKVSGLSIGDYTLTQVGAPEGYELPEGNESSREFAISVDSPDPTLEPPFTNDVSPVPGSEGTDADEDSLDSDEDSNAKPEGDTPQARTLLQSFNTLSLTWPTPPAGTVTIGPIRAQIANQTNSAGSTPSGDCFKYGTSTGGTLSSSGPTAWVNNPNEARGSHGYPTSSNCSNIKQSNQTDKASTVGVVPSLTTGVTPGVGFLLGAATHYNNPIQSSSERFKGDLKVQLTGLPSSPVITVPWNLWETPNNSASCPAGHWFGNGNCQDQIVFGSQIGDQIITTGGVKYRMVFSGFSPAQTQQCPATPPAGTQNEFWTDEGKNTTSCFYASLVEIRNLTIAKEVSPPVTSTQAFPFTSTSSLDGSPWDGGSFSLGDGDTDTQELLQGETVTVTENEPTGWTLESLQCTYDDGGKLSDTDAGAISVADKKLTITETPVNTDANQQNITCTFTNSPPHTKVELTKEWQDATAGDTVDLTVQTSDANTESVTSTAPNAPALAAQINVLPGDTVTVSEEFTTGDAANYTSSLSCDAEITPDANGSFEVPDSALGQTITCTFTNKSKPASVVVTKSWIIDGTAYAVPKGSGPELPDGFSADLTLTGQDSPAWGTEHSGYKHGGKVTVGEANVTYPNSCTNTPGGDLGEQTLATGKNTYTVANTVSCTVDVGLTKSWVHGITGDAVVLTITGDSVTGATGGSSTVPGTDTADATASATRGSVITLAEAFTTGDASQYDTTLRCTIGNVASDPISGLSGAFTIPADAMPGSAVSCEFTNSAKSSTLTLGKFWADNAKTGDTVGLAVTNATTDVSDDSGTSTAPDDDASGTTSSVTVYPGDTVTIAEGFSVGSLANYTATAECGKNNETVMLTNGSGTFTVPSNTEDITCTITNTRNEVSVSLQKQWLGAENGDKAGLSINDATGGDGFATSTADGTADQTDTDPARMATATVFAGDTVNLSEALPTGNTGSYRVTGFSCDAAGTNWTAGDSTSFTAPGSGPVVCTVTNARGSVDVTLQKAWVNGLTDDTADLSINGTTEGDGFNTSTATGGNETDTGNTATTSVPSGSTVNLEEMLEGNDGSYTVSDLSCTNAEATWANGAKTGSFTAPESGTVTCTFTNTRTAATINLQKKWVNGFGTDTAELTVSGSSKTDTKTSTSNGDAGTWTDGTNVASISALTGDEVTLSELMGTDNTGAYDATALSCVDPTGGPVGVSNWSTNGISGTIIASGSGTVTCTFTNERTSTELTLQKTWSGADTGDTAELFVNNTDGQQSGSDSATASVPASGTGDATQTVTVDVYSGDTLTLGETLPAGNTGSYTSSIVCSPTGGFTADDGGETGTLVVPTSNLADATTCTVSNSRSSVDVTLQKSWVDGADGDSAGLSINSGDPVQAIVPAAGNGISTGTASTSVPSGSTVNLAEALPFTDKTNTGSYDVTGLQCVDGDETLNVTWVEGDPAGSFTAPSGGDVTCTFTNERTQAGLTLQKTWVNGHLDDTTALTAGSATGSSTSGGQGGSWTDSDNAVVTPVFSGQQVDLSEVLGEDNTGSYTPTLSCDVDGLGDTEETTHGISGTFTMPSTAVDVTCEVTNTRSSATITLQKQWVDGAQDDTAALSLTSNGLSGPGSVASEVATDLFSGIQEGDSDTVTVYSGDMLTMAETLGEGNTGSYTTTLTCGEDGVELDDDLSATFGAPTVDTTCTYLNTRNAATITLAKVWENAAEGDTVALRSEAADRSESGDSVATGAASQTDSSVASMTVYSGEIVEVAEQLPKDGSTSTGTYDTTLSCSTESGLDDVADNGRFGAYTVPGNPEDVTCTFTNERDSSSVVLTKAWVNAIDGNAVDLTITDTSSEGEPTEGSSTTSGTAGGSSTAPGTGDLTDPASLEISVGDSFTVNESFTNGAAGNYNSDLSCQVGGVEGDDATAIEASQDGSFTVPAQAAGQTITCTYTNTRKPTPPVAELTITKTASSGSTLLTGADSFTYAINVRNDSEGTADPVRLSDPIPADIEITKIRTADSTTTPHWQGCAVTGTDIDGYGGALNCVLSGALLPGSAAPEIVLAATVRATAPAGDIVNTATVTWENPDRSEEPAKSDEASATVSVIEVLPTSETIEVLPTSESIKVLPTSETKQDNIAYTGVDTFGMGMLALLLFGGGGLMLLLGTVWRRRPARKH